MSGHEEQRLYCPSCGDSNVSVQSVQQVQPHPARHCVLVVSFVMACEQCTGGTIQFNFHKGETFIDPVPA